MVHGLTAGELARMAVGEGWIKSKPKLTVVPVRGLKRSMIWSDTGLKWVPTSPNIPDADSSAYYMATGIAQHVPAIDAGTGTASPFEYVAAKGINGAALAAKLNAAGFDGVKFKPAKSKKKAGWEGVRVDLDPRTPASLTEIDITILREIYVASKALGTDLIDSAGASGRSLLFKVYGSDSLRRDLAAGRTGSQIAASWRPAVERFKRLRAPYLLYR